MKVAVALGSNLDDRHAHLQRAIAALSSLLTRLRVSSFYETEPVGVPTAQPMFLNAAAVGECALSADALLQALLTIERNLGRDRPYPLAPRTIDLDLVLYADAIIERPELIVPHPRFRERRFVLEPLSEIAKEWIDPVTGCTVGELFARLRHDA